MSYPRTGDNKGSGEVATGRRLDLSTFGSPGFRFTLGGSGAVPSSYYEVFYDVYLKNASGGFNYEFRYWYRQVKEESPPGGVAPGVPKRWVPLPSAPSREIPIPQGPGVSVLTSIPGLGVSLPSLPLQGTTRPTTSVTWTPEQFGWKGSGSGTSTGTPFVGPGGGTPFPTRNPFGYKKSDNNGNNPGGGTEPGDTDSGGSADDDPFSEPGPPIPGFDRTRVTRMNPPPVITATGAYVPVVYDWEGNAVQSTLTEPDTRQSLLGYGSYSARLRRKATLIQYIRFEDEWRVGQGGQAVDEKGKVVDTWSTGDPLVPTGVRYGFRFMYNPSEIQFQMTPIEGIDPGVIISGLGRSYPMGDEGGGSINLTTYLNRIEDMAFLQRYPGGLWDYAGVNPYGDRQLSGMHKAGIAERGTGYDLEYLFRTTLGKPYVTQNRGVTADIGLILGLPLLLRLGGGMVYPGRLTGLSYTHLYFTSEMVPTFTQVSMSFTRFPDAKTFNPNPNPGGKGNNNNSRPGEYGPPGARRR